MFSAGFAAREILGNGNRCLTAQMRCWAAGPKRWCVEVFHAPIRHSCWQCCSGAFIGLGMMLAIKYLIDEKRCAAERSVLEGQFEKAS